MCLCTGFCFKAGLLSHEILHQSFILIPSGNNGRLLFQKANQSHLDIFQPPRLINGVHAIRMIIEERVDEEQNQKKEWH
jgi:hypothetical protein